MKTFVAAFCTVAALAMLAGVGTSAVGDGKYTIKEIMAKAHKGGNKSLISKAASGMAEKKDVENLLEMYQELAKNKPPQGEAASWKSKTDALVSAAKELKEGKEGAGKKLQKAANCMGCHSVHK